MTLHHDRIKPYVQRNLRFKDIRTDVNQQRDLLNIKTIVNQQREILSDIFTDSEAIRKSYLIPLNQILTQVLKLRKYLEDLNVKDLAHNI